VLGVGYGGLFRLEWRLKVIADGDPARGFQAVFCSVLFRKASGLLDSVPFEQDEVTTICCHRLRTVGSLYDDNDDNNDNDATTLDFSDSELPPEE
jgi:hypothetical protein